MAVTRDPDPQNIEKIIKWPTPRTIMDVCADMASNRVESRSNSNSMFSSRVFKIVDSYSTQIRRVGLRLNSDSTQLGLNSTRTQLNSDSTQLGLNSTRTRPDSTRESAMSNI